MIILLQITAACLICGHHSTPKKRVNASKKLSYQQQQWRFLFLSLQINIPWELQERSRFVLSIKISIEERPPHQPRLPAESQVISLKLWRMDGHPVARWNVNFLSNHLKCHTHRPPFSNGGSEGWKMEKCFALIKLKIEPSLSLSLSCNWIFKTWKMLMQKKMFNATNEQECTFEIKMFNLK